MAEWEHKSKIGQGLLEELRDLIDQVVVVELESIGSKMDTLGKMGILPNNEVMQGLQNRISEIKQKVEKTK